MMRHDRFSTNNPPKNANSSVFQIKIALSLRMLLFWKKRCSRFFLQSKLKALEMGLLVYTSVPVMPSWRYFRCIEHNVLFLQTLPVLWNHILHALDIQTLIGNHPLESAILCFRLTKATQFLFAHTRILVLPVVESRWGDVVWTADLIQGFAKFLFFENLKNLLLWKFALFHVLKLKVICFQSVWKMQPGTTRLKLAYAKAM